MEKYRKAIFIATYKIENGIPYYLILKRKLHWKGWEFPKGGIEPFELKRQTVRREIKEETGLKVKKIKNHKIKGKYSYKKIIPARQYTGQSFLLFSAEVYADKVIVDNREHSDYKWLKFEKAIKKLTWENQKHCLKIVDEWIKDKDKKNFLIKTKNIISPQKE